RAMSSEAGKRRWSSNRLFVAVAVCAAVLLLAIGGVAFIGVKHPQIAHTLADHTAPATPTLPGVAIDRGAEVIESPRSLPETAARKLALTVPPIAAPEIASPTTVFPTPSTPESVAAATPTSPAVAMATEKRSLPRASDGAIISLVNADL